MMAAENKKMSPAALAANVLGAALFFPLVILLLAGNWRWVEGWLFALWIVVMILFSSKDFLWELDEEIF